MLIRREAPTSLPWWVLIVSIVLGLLLMAAVIPILHKVRVNRYFIYCRFGLGRVSPIEI